MFYSVAEISSLEEQVAQVEVHILRQGLILLLYTLPDTSVVSIQLIMSSRELELRVLEAIFTKRLLSVSIGFSCTLITFLSTMCF